MSPPGTNIQSVGWCFFLALFWFLHLFARLAKVEVANRLCWYSRLKVWPLCSQAACEAMGFSYELTGVLGTKREHQITEPPELQTSCRCY